MLDDKSKAAQYWSTNLRLIMGSLIVWAFVSYGCGILFRGMLSDISVGGADLGFWFAQQGSILTFIVIIFFYAWRMNKLDNAMGLEE
jgi:putative solute:sodium symporter small subunit